MKNILAIKTSTSGENSQSNKVVDAIINKLKNQYPDSAVVERDLTSDPLPHIGGLTVAGFYTPAEHRNDLLNKALEDSDRAIKELSEADILVIGVPLHNFGIPSTLKAWIDHISRVGVTFYFDEQGTPHGMIENKKAYLAIASGGVYSDGPMKAFDFTEPYLRSILGFLGITNVSSVRAEGSAVPGLNEVALSNALSAVDAL